MLRAYNRERFPRPYISSFVCFPFVSTAGSSSSEGRIATPAMLSPSSSRMMRTPCVLRPMTQTSLFDVRIPIPLVGTQRALSEAQVSATNAQIDANRYAMVTGER